jgi:hypothetical protein
VLDRVRELLSRHDILAGEGVSDGEIRNAEGALGRFPDDYRYFLQEYGWISVEHLEIYGLGATVPAYLDVVRMTLSERLETGSPIPESYVCVMNDGAGNLFCFDTARSDQGEVSPIVFWDHELGPDQEPEARERSFEDWLTALLESEL